MNELALFAGAGGGILAGKILGWRCVCAVENDAYCRDVLLRRQDDGSLEPFPVWDDVRTFDGRPWRGCVDVVSGGFPCQDISAAGRGAGIAGERSGLWKSMSRIIGEVRPRFALVENSPVLTSRGLGVVLGDLAAMGYDAEWGVLGAWEAGGPHRRDRMWILANADGAGLGASGGTGSDCSGDAVGDAASGGEGVAQSSGSGLAIGIGAEGERAHSSVTGGDWWAVEPGMGGVVDGLAPGMDVHGSAAAGHVGRLALGWMANRVQRVKALGNGQVPACAALAWNRLNERRRER